MRHIFGRADLSVAGPMRRHGYLSETCHQLTREGVSSAYLYYLISPKDDLSYGQLA